MKDILYKILSIVIFTLLPSVFLRILKFRQENFASRFQSELKKDFDLMVKNIKEEYHKLNDFVDGKRELLISYLRKNKITKDKFFFINDRINEYINNAHIEYFKVLFKDYPDILTTLNIILLDKKITQDEIYSIFKEIRDNKNLTKEQQEYYISNFTQNYINNNKVINSEELFDSLKILNLNIYKKRLKWYFAIGLPVLIFLLSITYIERYKMGISKADFTFGIVLFRDGEIVSDYGDRLKEYIAEETGKDIDMKYYQQVNMNELFQDIVNGKINGLIINTGIYTAILENKPSILDEYMEVFASHQKNNKDYFTNSIVTLKSSFELFCKNKGISSEELDLINHNDKTKKIISEYINSGIFAFTDRYSMAGYLMPKILWDEFQVDLSNQQYYEGRGLVYTGSFDASLDGLLKNEIHSAAVITERISELSDKVKQEIIILHTGTDIPYHPYLISKKIDTVMKKQIVNSFKKLRTDNSRLANALKKNSMNITGFLECTSDEYYKKMENTLRVVIEKKLPKPKLYIENISTIPEYKENLNELIRMLKPKINEINVWELVDNESKHESQNKYHIKVNFFKDILGKIKKEMIHGYILKKDNIDSLLFEFIPDSLKGDEEKIRSALFTNIVNSISPKLKVLNDLNGLFIDKGRENGVKNCELWLNGNELIDSNNYVVEKTRTSFLFRKPEDINRYKDKIVYFRYRFQ